jgi:hypothetical protein
MNKISIPQALLVFAIWALLTFVLKYVIGEDETNIPLSKLVTEKLNYGIFFAALSLVLFSFLLKCHVRVGLVARAPFYNKILIVPLLIILISLAGSYYGGAFSDRSLIKWVLINTFFVGMSEELMFRGFLMSSFTNKFGYWPAVIWSSALFGAVHVINGFTTGEFGLAAIQALFAMSSGLLFLAVRVKTLSIIPAMFVHWIWDFTVFVSGSIERSADNPLTLIPPVMLLLGPVIFGIMGILALRNRDSAERYTDSQVIR